MQISQTLTTMWVSDLERAERWYETVLERPSDQIPMPNCREWKNGPAAILQVIADESRTPGRSGVAFVIAHFDFTLDNLRADGIEVGEVHEIEGFIRYTTLHDPDGNEVTLVENLRQ